MKKNLLLFVSCLYVSFLYAQNVGIGTTTPGSGLELKGTGLRSQQRITDATTNNSLVLQSGSGNNLKIGGYNYQTNTAQPLYLSIDGANTYINPNSGNVGIGTTTPGSKLTINAPEYGFEHTDGTRSFNTFLNATGVWMGSKSNHPLHFFTTGQQMSFSTAGQLSIGSTSATPGYLLDVRGPVRSESNLSTHVVTKTTGGVNSWARFYMQSNSQGWFMGTSENFNGNQLYIGEESVYGTRLSIQPNGGPIYMNGNITQSEAGYGLPKAMVYINSNGTIGRCYNAITGSTTGGCGCTSNRVSAGNYQVNFPFNLGTRFFSVTPEYGCCTEEIASSYKVFPPTTLEVSTASEDVFFAEKPVFTDMPVMIIVY